MINVPKDSLDPISMEKRSEKEVGEDLASTEKEAITDLLTKTTNKLNGEIKEKEKDQTDDSVKKLSSTQEKDSADDKSETESASTKVVSKTSKNDEVTDKKPDNSDTSLIKIVSNNATIVVFKNIPENNGNKNVKSFTNTLTKSTKEIASQNSSSSDNSQTPKSTKETALQNGSSSDNSQATKSTKETVMQNGLSKTITSKDKKKENSASDESRSDTPISHGSLDLDEEKLLHIDPDVAHDDAEDFSEEKLLEEDHEDFCEEKLLEEESSEEFSLKDEKNEETKPEDKSKQEEEEEEEKLSDKAEEGTKTDQNKSLFEDKDDSLADEQNDASSDRQEKEIKKILKNLNNSLENKSKTDNTDSTTFRKISSSSNNSSSLSSNPAENSESKSSESDTVVASGNNSNSNSLSNSSLSKLKMSDTVDSNKSSLVKRKLSDASKTSKRKLSVSSSNSTSASSLGKGKPSESNEDGDSNSSKKILKLTDKSSKPDSKDGKSSNKSSSGSSKPIPKESSEKIGSKSAITFSEALKSIAMEDTMFQDKPKPLVPTAEISSETTTSSTTSLTLLQPVKNSLSSASGTTNAESESQGKKRSLPDGGNSDLPTKPDLKKIKINKHTDNKTTFKSIPEVEVQKDESRTASRDSIKNSNNSEKKSLCRTSEDKDIMNIDNEDNIMEIDKDDLQRKTIEEMQKANLSNSKLRRIKRKDLESLIIDLFIDKVLYEHQLGQHKDLCKRLEATLENNRKKAAQFHKEIEDLKKVTHRLQAEHLARKSHLVAPVKVKRSVGIQATPTIIGKGMMSVSSNSNIRVLSPSATSSSPSSSNIININSNQSTPSSMANSSKTINISGPQSNAGTQVMVPFVVQQQSQNAGVGSQFIPVTTTRIVRTPLTPINSSGTQFTTSSLPSSVSGASVVAPVSSAVSSSFIDLTDDDEAKNQRASLQAGGIVAIQRTTAVGMNINQNSQGQFVLNPPTSVGQLLLVPSANGQPTTALVVGSVANNNNTTSVVRTSNVKIAASPVGIVSQAPRTVQMNGPSFVAQLPRHPAPLPKAPPQQTSGYSKKLPPLPTLKLSHKDNSIVLSWNMAKTDEHERIASYQIYAYQEGTASPTPTLWKKVGSVKALDLPMACTLTQFMPGHVYHFAVRAVDIRSRLGPFSEPKSIRLGI